MEDGKRFYKFARGYAQHHHHAYLSQSEQKLDDEENIFVWRLASDCFYSVQATGTERIKAQTVLGVSDVLG